MTRAFSKIAFTPAVRAAQQRHGSRELYAPLDDAGTPPRDSITARDADLIARIDTFFLSSVGANGWPYVQHRGGPRGFLKVLDERTLGFADYAGNRQYISAGNIGGDDRVMLILVDFATRRRMKIWGHARLVHLSEDPALLARLSVPGYRAEVERGIVIDVAAIDLNCPQHITQRFSAEELRMLAANPDGQAILASLLDDGAAT